MNETAFVLERTNTAPRALVWRTFTGKDQRAGWYGPGVETVIHTRDARPGGVRRNEMRFGGNASFERMDDTEVTPRARLAWAHVTTDPDWNPIPNPMMPGWPTSLLAEVDFADADDGTRVTLAWTRHDASAEQTAVVRGAMEGFGRGSGTGFDIVTEILADLQARAAQTAITRRDVPVPRVPTPDRTPPQPPCRAGGFARITTTRPPPATGRPKGRNLRPCVS